MRLLAEIDHLKVVCADNAVSTPHKPGLWSILPSQVSNTIQ